MGGGAKSKSVSYSGSSNPAFQPAALQGVANVNSVFNQAQPGLQALTNTAQNTVVPGLTNQFQQGLGTAAQARGYNSDVLSGKYLNGNPYIQNILNQLNSQVANDTNSQFSLAGRYGSGAHTDVLSRNLANADSNLLYGNYADEMNRMGQSAGAAQQGSIADTAGLLQALQQSSTMPYAGSESLANSLGALFSGGQEKSTQKSASPLWSAIGSGLGALAAVKSDIEAKTEVKDIGSWDGKDGLRKISYRYHEDEPGTVRIGVIAQQVAKLRPWALGPVTDGMMTVRYGLL